MHDDVQLLRAYAETGSQPAFRELVERRISLVYGIALRRVGGDAHLAQEVAGRVFCDLARKAPALCRHPELSGWLFISTRYAASDLVRSERRRHAALTAMATSPNAFAGPADRPETERLAPFLDDVLERLKDSDRQALLLRFYEGCSFAEVGRKLALTENAARMRVERALEKARRLLSQRGVVSSAEALALALPLQAASAAPAGLSAAVAQSAITGASVSTGSLLLKLMSLSKLQIAAAAAAVVIASGGLATIRAEYRSNQALEAKIGQMEGSTADLQAVVAVNGRLQAEVAQLRSAVAAQQRVAATRAASSSTAQGAAFRVAKHYGSSAEMLAAEPTYDISKLDVQPLAIDQGRPTYPPSVRSAGRGGRVLVDFVVGLDGSVIGAHAVQSDDPDLANSAVAAVSTWLFKPGIKGTIPVNTHMQVPIVFTLNQGDAPKPAKSSS